MQWVCHCTVHAYDGVSTLTARPTEVVEATSEQEACAKVRQTINERYEQLGCSINSIAIPLARQVTPQKMEVRQNIWKNALLNEFRARTVMIEK